MSIAAAFALSLGLTLLIWPLLGSKLALWAALPLVLLAQLETYHILAVGRPSTIGMIGALFDINPNEGFELVGSSLILMAVCVALVAMQTVFLWNARGLGWALPHRRTRLRTLALVWALFLPEAVRLSASDSTISIEKALVVDLEATIPFGTIAKICQAVASKRSIQERTLRTRDFDWKVSRSAAEGPRPETHVVILGESSRSGSWSRYGYHKPTTPWLDADTSLLVMKDLLSGANNTSESLPLYLTLATPDRPERFDSTSSMLSCFRQAGFKTWWLSSQTQFGGWDSKSTLLGKEADIFRFLSYENGTLLDQRLLPLLDSAILDTTSKKLIVLHTLGSHFQYEHRYPEAFARFPVEAGRKNTQAAYDNSILYTDWFIGQVLSRIRTLPGIRAVTYLGDHGESFGENGCLLHSNPKPSKAEFEVPFLVWASPELRRSRPEVVSNFRSHLAAKASSTDILPTLLDFADIHSPLVDSNRSLARGDYRPHRRLGLLLPGTIQDLDQLPGSSLAGVSGHR